MIRGVREGRGGQGREGVQLPDSLVDEAVFQSVCPGLMLHVHQAKMLHIRSCRDHVCDRSY